MPESGGRPIAPPPRYYYRRELSLREMLPALGVGLGVGMAAFYVARLLLQRAPLERATLPASRPTGAMKRPSPARPAG